MKKATLILMAVLCCGIISTSALAQDTKTVKFNVSMTCENCVEKITENVSFEKGVKDLKVTLEDKTVEVTYDPSKTNEKALAESITKLGYTVSTVDDSKTAEVKGATPMAVEESNVKPVEKAGDKIKETTATVDDKTVETANKVGDVTVETANKVGDVTVETATKVGDKTKETANKVGDKTKETANKVGEKTKDAANKVGDFFKKDKTE